MDESLIDAMTKDFVNFERDTRTRPLLERIGENIIKVVTLSLLVWLSACDFVQAIYELFMLSGSRVFVVELIGPVIIGLFFADLFIGVAHLFFDHVRLDAVPSSSRPFLQWAAYGFQYHHAVPTSWNDGDFFYLGILRTGFTASAPFFLCQILLLSNATARIGMFAMAFACLFCQVPHAAAHGRWRQSSLKGVITLMQQTGLFVSPKAHHEHHTYFDRNFAMVNGWSQPLVNALYKHVYSRVVNPDMLPEIQRKVYVNEKQDLKRPYLQMFPDCRT